MAELDYLATGVGWSVRAESRRIQDDLRFDLEAPTGTGWGKCGCGERIEGLGGTALPLEQVEEKLRAHVDTEHPDWPEEMRP